MWTDEKINVELNRLANRIGVGIRADTVAPLMRQVRDEQAAELERLHEQLGYALNDRDDALAKLAAAQAENRALRSILAYELTLFPSEVDDKIAETLAANAEAQP